MTTGEARAVVTVSMLVLGAVLLVASGSIGAVHKWVIRVKGG